MESLKKYDNIIKIFRSLAIIVGADIFSPNFKFNFLTYFTIFAITLFWITVFNSIYVYWGSLELIIRCLAVFAVGSQASAKYFTILRYPKLYKNGLEFVRSLYVVNLKSTSVRHKLLKGCIDRASICVKIGLIVCSIATLLVFAYPILNNFYYGKKELVIETVLPGIDWKTNIGYILNISNQSFEICCGIFPSAANDMIFALMVWHTYLLAQFLQNSIDEINEIIEYNMTSKKIMIFRQKLRNIIYMHQDIINFISMIDKLFRIMIFCQIATTIVSLCMCFLLILKANYYPAYGLALYALFQLLLYCSLGTIIENVNHKIEEAFYNIRWYLIPIEDRKVIYLALLRSQNAKILSILGIAPLNINTGSSVLQTIYSYLMVLLKTI